MKKRVVIVGLGDTGLLVAMGLNPEFEVVGITPKPALVSGQELGLRVSRPDDWRRYYRIPFERYRGLRGVSVRHGLVTGLAVNERSVRLKTATGESELLEWDALVLAPGVTNGFWRTATVETAEQVERSIDEIAARLATARSIAVIGGGASAVSAASNLKEAHPSTSVTLAFSQSSLLTGYHPRVRETVQARLIAQGIHVLPEHRAEVPPDGAPLTSGPVRFVTGQPPVEADVTLWAIGQVRPNTAFLPPELLDANGFIRVDGHLRVPTSSTVFAVGDAAATDPQRCSARNGGAKLVARNVRAMLRGHPDRLSTFRPPSHRWGSIFGPQRDGLRVYAPAGFSVRIAPFLVRQVLFPWIVERVIYGGVEAVPSTRRSE